MSVVFLCVVFFYRFNYIYHKKKDTQRTMWSITEENFKIDFFMECTDLIECYPQQWANINNAKYWCHTGIHRKIESQKKLT